METGPFCSLPEGHFLTLSQPFSSADFYSFTDQFCCRFKVNIWGFSVPRLLLPVVFLIQLPLPGFFGPSIKHPQYLEMAAPYR
jgi:hypothetical protein